MAKKESSRCIRCDDTGLIVRGKWMNIGTICLDCNAFETKRRSWLSKGYYRFMDKHPLSWLWRKIRGKEDKAYTDKHFLPFTLVTTFIWTLVSLITIRQLTQPQPYYLSLMFIAIPDAVNFNFLTIRIIRGLMLTLNSLFQKGKKSLMKKDPHRGLKYASIAVSAAMALAITALCSMTTIDAPLSILEIIMILSWGLIPGTTLFGIMNMRDQPLNNDQNQVLKIGDELEQLMQEKQQNELPEINRQVQNIAAKIEALKNQRSQAQSRSKAIAGKSLLQQFEPQLQELINNLSQTIKVSEDRLRDLGVIRDSLNQQVEDIRIQLNDRATAVEIEKFLTDANQQAAKVSDEIQSSIIIACEKLQATSNSLRQLCSDMLASLGLEPSQYMEKLSVSDRQLLERINQPALNIQTKVISQQLKVPTT